MKNLRHAAWLALVLATGCTDRGSGPAPASAERKIGQASAESREKVANAREKSGDAAITAKVKAALIKAPGIKAAEISVDTDRGVVILAGNVDTPYSRSRAQEIAESVGGVKSVDNRLTVGATG